VESEPGHFPLLDQDCLFHSYKVRVARENPGADLAGELKDKGIGHAEVGSLRLRRHRVSTSISRWTGSSKVLVGVATVSFSEP